MKTCSKCGELNGENAIRCFKCNNSFGPQDNYKKICQKCGSIYSSRTENCKECGSRLAVYTSDNINSHSSVDRSGFWMYIVAVLFPIVGIILGCVYIARREDETGKSLILTSIFSVIICIILGVMIRGCLGL
ncbi:hypothetical protein [Vallitalea guaymasensis]|uniref:hypothetical protein n=1 Tax=Vallitalea guaymasensis TaxID=1185412 RepID=UPI002352479B|nr:hypothetical protein [Vallitalea guaymasensis]